MRPLLLALGAILFPLLCAAAPLPELAGKDLLGAEFKLQERLAGRPAVLVFGFTKDSDKETRAWAQGLAADAQGSSAFAVVSVALLEKAPGFVRGFIKKGMRKGSPAERHAWMVVLEKDTKLWEEALGYDPKVQPDHARLLVLGPDGKPLDACATHEAHSDGARARLLACLKDGTKKAGR
jgi:hypothetical protein